MPRAALPAVLEVGITVAAYCWSRVQITRTVNTAQVAALDRHDTYHIWDSSATFHVSEVKITVHGEGDSISAGTFVI